MDQDTIVAISTATGIGAISIIRLSGKDAISIVNNIFKGPDLTKVQSHTINYGYIIDGNEMIDEVLVSVMLTPKTYTTENVVEINCHGGISTTNKVLSLTLKHGARLAEPGEFTKRAFLNGRLNLLEAESVSDLISSQSEKQRAMAMNGLNGRLTNLVQEQISKITDIIANIEVNIDYPAYEDALEVTPTYLKKELKKLQADLTKLYENAQIGQMIKTGLDIALIGRPNVGKSSLLNAFLNEDRAIVTDISGTTRDLIEAKTTIKGIEVNLIDTAGIRESTDLIEKMGIDKSRQIIKTADLVILVLNNNESLTEEDKDLIKSLENKKSLIFVNKDDLPTKIDTTGLEVVKGNTKTLDGIEALINKISEMYNLDKLEAKDNTYLSNARQINLVAQALLDIEEAIKDCDKEIPIDMLEIHLKSAWEKLRLLIGDTYEDELIDTLFKNFCLGK